MEEIRNNPNLDLQVLVSGMHMSEEFGLTYREIEADGFLISEKVDMHLDSDSPNGICRSTGTGMIGIGEALEQLKPDLLALLGDRFEAFAAAAAAMILRIPIAHLHGGETTFGVIDEPIRHSITKMSHLHFTSTEEYRNRVIQLGENPDRVFNVGAIGIENIKHLDLMTRTQLEESINFSLGDHFFLVTFHPATLEDNSAGRQFTNLLASFGAFPEYKIIFTKANADTNGRVINKLIDEYVTTHSEQSIAFTSMGQLRYLSAMQHTDAVVGNSSSGILEAPSFKVPTINIGDRQKGRIQASSVIDCKSDTEDIVSALRLGLSSDFKEKLQHTSNPYELDGTARNITKIIKEYDLSHILKKEFFDCTDNIK